MHIENEITCGRLGSGQPYLSSRKTHIPHLSFTITSESHIVVYLQERHLIIVHSNFELLEVALESWDAIFNGFYFPLWQDIFKKLQLWKLVVSVFSFSSTSELMFGIYLLYYFRVFERQIGSNKYSVSVHTIQDHLWIFIW